MIHFSLFSLSVSFHSLCNIIFIVYHFVHFVLNLKIVFLVFFVCLSCYHGRHHCCFCTLRKTFFCISCHCILRKPTLPCLLCKCVPILFRNLLHTSFPHQIYSSMKLEMSFCDHFEVTVLAILVSFVCLFSFFVGSFFRLRCLNICCHFLCIFIFLLHHVCVMHNTFI